MHDGHKVLLERTRPVAGPGAAALKYDILTALLVMAAQGAAVEARLALRLSLLITARYNWRQGHFAVGQKELARMWGVSERTAKREMAALRAHGWISVMVPSARGRVAQYRIEMAQVLRATAPHWAAVGPDFTARMSGVPDPEVRTQDNVVPLHPEIPPELPPEDDTGWHAAARILQHQDPALYAAWFKDLVPVALERGTLTLRAPSRFIASYVETHYKNRLMAAFLQVGPSICMLHVVSPQG